MFSPHRWSFQWKNRYLITGSGAITFVFVGSGAATTQCIMLTFLSSSEYTFLEHAITQFPAVSPSFCFSKAQGLSLFLHMSCKEPPVVPSGWSVLNSGANHQSQHLSKLSRMLPNSMSHIKCRWTPQLKNRRNLTWLEIRLFLCWLKHHTQCGVEC